MEQDPADPQPAAETAGDAAGETGKPSEPAQSETLSPKMVYINGHFPGKQGECALIIQLAPDQYDEEKILQMLKSIR